MMRVRGVLAITAITLTAGVPMASAADTANLAAAGCAMAHCDQAITGNAQQAAPAPAAVVWHDTTAPGSHSGLGCVSNTHQAVCSFANRLFNWTSLRAYSPGGQTLWSSILLDHNAYASAPMIAPDSSVIAADDRRIVRFSPNGAVLWQTQTPGGIPISPNITDEGIVVLATSGGPVSTYDAVSGQLLATLKLTSGSSYYDTVNTPAVDGNRVYVVTALHDRPSYGRLYALDVGTHGELKVAWSWDFEGPSGGSPTVLTTNGMPVVYLDGSGATAGSTTTSPFLFAVQDVGTEPALLWRYPLGVDAQAAATPDPRGGVWTNSTFSPTLVRLDQVTGALLQTINTANLVSSACGGCAGIHAPSSAMTITGSASDPVMLVSATPILMQSSYVLAIDLQSGTLLWSYRVDQGKGLAGVPFGQDAVVMRADGRPEIVFSTYCNGVWALAAP